MTKLRSTTKNIIIGHQITQINHLFPTPSDWFAPIGERWGILLLIFPRIQFRGKVGSKIPNLSPTCHLAVQLTVTEATHRINKKHVLDNFQRRYMERFVQPGIYSDLSICANQICSQSYDRLHDNEKINFVKKTQVDFDKL